MRDAVKMARSKQYSMCIALALHLKPSPKRSESDPLTFVLMTFNDKLALLIIIFFIFQQSDYSRFSEQPYFVDLQQNKIF